MSVFEKLAAVQAELKAPKSQYNSFGKYNYRNCEDIIEAAKPLLKKNGLMLAMTDQIVLIGDRFYVEATATVYEIETGTCFNVKAYAREEAEKKGMDGSQVTGASSSYARKYALNGLFAIDDTKDSDATNHGDDKPSVKLETVDDAFNIVFTFGKHSGKTIGDVWKSDFEYIKWLNGNEKTDPIIKQAISMISEHLKGRKPNG